MDNFLLLSAITALTLLAVTLHAWRIGNERRDVALLGTVAGLCGLGTAVVAII
jgi:hypothetical protein